jgi:uncharacterized protein YcbK (DUF882 family)
VSLKYFSIGEFACKHCGDNKIDLGFVSELDDMRHRYGNPLVVTSGYRCPDHNAKVSSTGRAGPHTTGHAADLSDDRADAFRLLRIATTMRFTGIGFQQKGVGRFIHLDDLPNTIGTPRPAIWSY